jgi:hypothetical protein
MFTGALKFPPASNWYARDAPRFDDGCVDNPPFWRAVAKSAVVAKIHCPVGRRALLRRGAGLQGFPGRLELGLGRVEILT